MQLTILDIAKFTQHAFQIIYSHQKYNSRLIFKVISHT